MCSMVKRRIVVNFSNVANRSSFVRPDNCDLYFQPIIRTGIVRIG